MMVKNILVYIDGSEESIIAAEYGIILAKSVGARLSALYVVNTRAVSDLVKSHIFLDIEKDEYTRDMEKDADRYLHLVEKLATSKGVQVELHKDSGSVHGSIRSFIKEHDIDLLLLGELSNMRSRRDELYDAADRALRSAPCSVMVVKNPVRVESIFEEL